MFAGKTVSLNFDFLTDTELTEIALVDFCLHTSAGCVRYCKQRARSNCAKRFSGPRENAQHGSVDGRENRAFPDALTSFLNTSFRGNNFSVCFGLLFRESRSS